MMTIRKVNIKNCPYFLFNTMTNIKKFDPNLLSIDKISFKKYNDCVIYEIEYFKNFSNKNSLYLVFNNVDAYIEYNITEDDSETKYLVFFSADNDDLLWVQY